MDVVAEGVETDEQPVSTGVARITFKVLSGRPLPVAAWQQIAEHLPSREFG